MFRLLVGGENETKRKYYSIRSNRTSCKCLRKTRIIDRANQIGSNNQIESKLDEDEFCGSHLILILSLTKQRNKPTKQLANLSRTNTFSILFSLFLAKPNHKYLYTATKATAIISIFFEVVNLLFKLFKEKVVE